MLIVFEGPDGCGKSTQAKRLYETLSHLKTPCHFLKFPDPEHSLGRMFYEGVGKLPTVYLQAMAVAEMASHLPLLKSAKQGQCNIICDRYVRSTLVFSRAMIENLNQARALHWACFALPQPNIEFVLTNQNARRNIDNRAEQSPMESAIIQEGVTQLYTKPYHGIKPPIHLDVTDITPTEAYTQILDMVGL